MKFRIQANAEVDLLSRDELKQELRAHAQLLTGGVTYRWVLPAGSTTQSTPGPQLWEFVPRHGYVWDVQTISVLKSTSGAVRVSLAEDTPSGFVTHVPDDGLTGNTLLVSSKSLIVPAQVPLQIRTVGAFNGTGNARILVKEVLAIEQWRL
ncbi:hypothetical protein [Actinocrispum wychmicini]|uniref:Uncharacterized protein n=1 Tax=Actinocrispum wychmicini TaxID=1213861 RepID=A0A4R2J4C6_9PSEU|nr:hypothetical protein [Actinocrispum wychmicini]TCO52984.1 hypothetical protein EV192_111178 [Actinocrispum wychmicini]